MKKNNLLTEGPILKSLIILALPIIFANLLHVTYQLIDTFWVGRLGAVAIAAVSVSFPVVFLLVSLGSGLAIAGTILVSQYKGKDEIKAVNYIAAQTLLMITLVSIILSGTGYYLSPFFISLLGVQPEVFPSAVSYMKISFIGMVFIFNFMVFQSLMRGAGDVKTPMFIVLGTVLLNFIIDPLFIFGYGIFPGMGVAGAAFATIITQGIAAAVGISLLLKGKHKIHLHLRNLVPDTCLIGKIFKLGLPASLEQSTIALGMNVIIFLVTSFGTVVLAAYGIVIRILSFVVIPTIGLSMATSTLVGQNIGAGKIKRAEGIVRLAAIISFGGLTLVGILMFLFARPLSTLFIPGETETINISVRFIKIIAFSFGFIGIQKVLNGAFIGSGNTMLSMTLSVITMWGLRFPIAYMLSRHTPLLEKGIWASFPASYIIAALITIVWFFRGTWKHKKITEEIKVITERTGKAIIEKGGISP